MTGMNCPACGAETGVRDSRSRCRGEMPVIMRKRICKTCGFRFRTFEVTESDITDLESVAERTAQQMDRLKSALLGELVPVTAKFRKSP